MTTRADLLTGAVRLVGLAQRELAEAWVRDSGISRAQGFALRYLTEHRDRDVIAREIAEASGTTPASVTSLLQGLEARGLITRTSSPHDSRVKVVRVTPEGEQIIAGFDVAMRAAFEAFYAPLSEAEQDQLLTLLERLVENVEVPSRPGGPPGDPRRRPL